MFRYSASNAIIMFYMLFIALITYSQAENITSAQWGERFFQLAMNLSHYSSNATTNKLAHSGLISVIHIIRVPKASSSSLSAVARRFVGCYPAGPCCVYPGDPPGSCPNQQLFECEAQQKVIGCTHHHANYQALRNSLIPSISTMREPMSRAVSAFFYPGIHHNSRCKHSQEVCFLEYTSAKTFSNIVVKQLTGAYAYANVVTCRLKTECQHSLERAVHNLDSLKWMGITEMWELSLLLLHMIFPQIIPDKDEFTFNDRHSLFASSAAAAQLMQSTKHRNSTAIHPNSLNSTSTRNSTRIHQQRNVTSQVTHTPRRRLTLRSNATSHPLVKNKKLPRNTGYSAMANSQLIQEAGKHLGGTHYHKQIGKTIGHPKAIRHGPLSAHKPIRVDKYPAAQQPIRPRDDHFQSHNSQVSYQLNTGIIAVSPEMSEHRSNENHAYKQFKSVAFERYKDHLHLQNGLDIELYQIVLQNICDDLHAYHLWNNFPFIREYWREKIQNIVGNYTVLRCV